MQKAILAFVPAVLILGGCSDLNPYDRSKYEKAETPISEHTNHELFNDENANRKFDPNKPFAKQEEPDDWGASTPRGE